MGSREFGNHQSCEAIAAWSAARRCHAGGVIPTPPTSAGAGQPMKAVVRHQAAPKSFNLTLTFIVCRTELSKLSPSIHGAPSHLRHSSVLPRSSQLLLNLTPAVLSSPLHRSIMATRPAAKAGSWYEDDTETLKKQLKGFLAAVPNSIDGATLPVPGARIIIAP